MQVVLEKSLTALSVVEMGQVLSHLGLDCFVANFKKNEVCALLQTYDIQSLMSHILGHMRQIGGAGIQGINLQELGELAPESTRVERALLLRTIRDLDTATQVSHGLSLCMRRTAMHPNIIVLPHCITVQSLSVKTDVLGQLNVWFPGKFRAITDPPIYDRADTTIVRATHKVSFNIDI